MHQYLTCFQVEMILSYVNRLYLELKTSVASKQKLLFPEQNNPYKVCPKQQKGAKSKLTSNLPNQLQSREKLNCQASI